MKRLVKFNIYEEPFYTLLFKKRLGDSYQHITAPNVIADILIENVDVDAMRVVHGDDDPKIPSFINPNWTPAKTIRYMQNYGDKGPIKVFNITKNNKTVTIVAPLQKLIENKVFSQSPVIIPNASGQVSSSIRLPDDYVIRGVNAVDKQSDLAGHSMYTFDYFHGNKSDVVLPDFQKEAKADYSYHDEFDKKVRSYGAIIAGNYTQGAEIVSRTGNYLMHKKKVFSQHEHNYTLDVESKPLVATKLLNKFYNNFYDEIMMEMTLPGVANVHCGQTFQIYIPSANKGDENNMTYDEQLSGDWLLIKMEHKMWTPEKKDWQYQMKCYFVRTGLEYNGSRRLTDRAGGIF